MREKYWWLVAGADLVWEKSTAAGCEQNRVAASTKTSLQLFLNKFDLPEFHLIYRLNTTPINKLPGSATGGSFDLWVAWQMTCHSNRSGWDGRTTTWLLHGIWNGILPKLAFPSQSFLLPRTKNKNNTYDFNLYDEVTFEDRNDGWRYRPLHKQVSERRNTRTPLP